MPSKIEWTDETWNPVTGCTKVSAGCANCYAERMAKRLAGRCGYPADDPFRVTLHPDRLDQPLRWHKPRRIFVCSMSDVFHEDVDFAFVDQIFAAAAFCPRHTLVILTKRERRMLEYIRDRDVESVLTGVGQDARSERAWTRNRVAGRAGMMLASDNALPPWPLPNVHVGVTVEDQAHAYRIGDLLKTPAAVRFVSYEPALGPVKLRHDWLGFTQATGELRTHKGKRQIKFKRDPNAPRIDGVICGGESGPGARPMHPEWARSLRDQCVAAGAGFFFKQWGEWVPAFSQYGDEYGNDICDYDIAEHSDRWSCEHPAARHVCMEPSGDIVQGEDPRTGEYFCDHQPGGGAWWMYRVGKKAAGRILDGKIHDQLPGARNECPRTKV